ncbi:hypothetical protein Q5P01_000641 [Channa striata]|uniref:Uncharacterized protein n=1 Tax=Channa striata TaxID=64152 RepID=A0AA88IYY6_CHASR|nr:hypothetical protein Q5P01_000641 [Channa striata]
MPEAVHLGDLLRIWVVVEIGGGRGSRPRGGEAHGAGPGYPARDGGGGGDRAGGSPPLGPNPEAEPAHPQARVPAGRPARVHAVSTETRGPPAAAPDFVLGPAGRPSGRRESRRGEGRRGGQARARSARRQRASQRSALRGRARSACDCPSRGRRASRLMAKRPSDRRSRENRGAKCVRSVDDQCVLQFTLVLAASCVLHRRLRAE